MVTAGGSVSRDKCCQSGECVQKCVPGSIQCEIIMDLEQNTLIVFLIRSLRVLSILCKVIVRVGLIILQRILAYLVMYDGAYCFQYICLGYQSHLRNYRSGNAFGNFLY